MTNCNAASYDNRETCTLQLPSSCMPYTGYVSPTIFTTELCRPNINDILKKLQEVIDAIKTSLGDNSLLEDDCLDLDMSAASQSTINQKFITDLCLLKTAVDALEEPIDPDTIILAVDLLCLLDPTCVPTATYTLTDVIKKLISAYCNLLTISGIVLPVPSNNYSVTPQNPIAATRTYVTGSKITVPSTKLKVGTILKWKFNVTKTAAGTASSVIDVAVGTTGTVADTARLSFTKPAGTAVVDEGLITITAVVRSIGVAGIMVGEFTLIHNLASTGHAIVPAVVINNVSAAFDMTTPNLFVGVCITTGAADAITIEMVTAEALNL